MYMFGKCANPKISDADWVCNINELDKDVTYIIGSFNHGNAMTMVSYKNGIYCFANKESVESYAHYKFNNLSRAYNYFEEMYYK